LSSLSSEFGLQPLIGKSLAVIADARIGKQSSIVVERLLSISGEDRLTVNRKFKEQWCGTLSARIHILSNELPKLNDASAAIIGRIVLLLLSNSWLGKEDLDLEPDLHRQLPGILNWALDGLQRLTVANANRFTQLPTSDDAILSLRDLASPVAAFVREKCKVGPKETILVDTLYAAYKIWADNNGHPKSPKHVFGRDLRAAAPSIDRAQLGSTNCRTPAYTGIRLCDPDDSKELL
jgi:putative DNA primase/helicase